MGRQLRWAAVAALGLWAGAAGAGVEVIGTPNGKLIGPVKTPVLVAPAGGIRILPQRCT